MATATDEWIAVDYAGVARIVGTRFRVSEIVNQYQQNRTVAEICGKHPSLSRQQAEAALTYYGEHAARIDAEAGEASRLAATPEHFEAEELRTLEEEAANERAFESLRNAIRREHAGRYVGFAFGRVIASDADIEVVRAVMDALDPQPRSQAVFWAVDEPAFAHYWDTYAEYQ